MDEREPHGRVAEDNGAREVSGPQLDLKKLRRDLTALVELFFERDLFGRKGSD